MNAIRYIYTFPFLYAAPYFLAALLAIFLVEKSCQFLSKTTRIAGKQAHWITVAYLLFFEYCHALKLPIISQDDSSSKVAYAFSIICLSVVFSLATLVWITSLVHAKESAVCRFLSSRFFLPFSRLSFGIYLLNMLVIWFNAHQVRTLPTLHLLSIVRNSLCLFYLIFNPYFLRSFKLYSPITFKPSFLPSEWRFSLNCHVKICLL